MRPVPVVLHRAQPMRRPRWEWGRRGRGYGGGIVTTPIATFFGMREKITFLSIENAMKTYKVMNDGPPKTQKSSCRRS